MIQLLKSWLTDKNGNKLAPKTLLSQILNNDGSKFETDYISLKDKVNNIPTKLSEFTDDLGNTPVHTHSQYAASHNPMFTGGGIQVTSDVDVIPTMEVIMPRTDSIPEHKMIWLLDLVQKWEVPTKLSQLTNDSEFTTISDQTASVTYSGTDLQALIRLSDYFTWSDNTSRLVYQNGCAQFYLKIRAARTIPKQSGSISIGALTLRPRTTQILQVRKGPAPYAEIGSAWAYNTGTFNIYVNAEQAVNSDLFISGEFMTNTNPFEAGTAALFEDFEQARMNMNFSDF